jgi:hypothetical protein
MCDRDGEDEGEGESVFHASLGAVWVCEDDDKAQDVADAMCAAATDARSEVSGSGA